MSTTKENTAQKIREFVLQGVSPAASNTSAKEDALWQALGKTGTELWLDSGDIDAINENWTKEFTSLTTNNTLLNKEVQKGIYDDFIQEADGLLEGMDLDQRVTEIAFVLNARHGLRLVEKFGADVSVELHTNLSFDLDGILHYGRRFHEISPEHFIVKVPFTSTGLLGARKLREEGIRVNLTLGFSARQNVLVAKVAKPDFCNVFLGRLGGFVKQNGLGDGENVGEKTTIASQKAVHEVGGDYREPTRQIAASMRNADQIRSLAGIDVFTMPTKVASEGKKTLSADFSDQTGTDLPVTLSGGATPAGVKLDRLWETRDDVYRLAESLDQDVPESDHELVDRARKAGCADMFPDLSDADLDRIARDGKIPDYTFWKKRIDEAEVGIDTLMNLSGLAAFTADQSELDDRVRGIIK